MELKVLSLIGAPVSLQVYPLNPLHGVESPLVIDPFTLRLVVRLESITWS